jgi:Mce-associated membrane protein
MTPRRRNLLALGMVALVLAAVVVGGFAGRRVLDARHDQTAGDDAVAAASQLGVNFTTLDYQSFDRDSGRVLAGSTGEFKKEFSAQSAELKKLVTANKAVSKGKVLSAGLVSHDADSARVLLVVDADVTNTSATTPVPRHYRIQVDLSRAGSRWLANQLQFVG